MQPGRFKAGTLVGGRFEVERLAGTGGMGEVYRAKDRETGSPVALKFLRDAASGNVARFEREARALSALAHPGIVRYVAHGHDPSTYLAMEWLEGVDLARRLDTTPMSLSETLTLAKVVTDALGAAHERGIVHRDIKPSNIFLCEGRIERAKLLDFGVARLSRASTRAITGTGQLVGTLGYMAPEQAMSGRAVTSAVDVFSLGCVLFECLAGRGPFGGEWIEVLSKILLTEPPRLREARPDVPHVVDELVARMLRKDATTRATLSSIASDLADLLAMGGDENAPRGRGAPPVTSAERRLLTVIVSTAKVEGEDGSVPSSPTGETVASTAIPLVGLVARFEAKLELLPDKTPLVTLSSTGAATDLAARAARCALAMRELLGGAPLAVASGRGDSSEPAVVADAASRAQRLLAFDQRQRSTTPDLTSRRAETLAPGAPCIRIDPVTAGLLDPSFEVTGDGSTLVLVGQRPGDAVRKLLGKETPCVGRERELAVLDGLVTDCIEEPLSTALLITAAAGVGKSRMRYEILRGLRARPESPEIWMAHGDPINAGSSYGMVAQLVREMAGLVDGELVEVRRQKLLARVGRNLSIEDATRVAQFLGEIVRADFEGEGRPLLRQARQDPSVMNDQIRRAWEDLVAAETSASPLVLVLEDLQWGDLPSIRLLDGALRSQRQRPLLVVALARPEVHELFPQLFRERHVHELRLADLSPRAAKRLVHEVLGEGVEAGVADAIALRANGNAFYLEELIRAAAEGDAGQPSTVIAMIQSRLEHLEPGARRALRAASVFGSRFWVGGVASLVGTEAIDVRATLEDLVHRELVIPSSTSRFQGETEYAFRHILVREAAYEMLAERDRRASHLAAADWLEANGERDALVLAEHIERSGEAERAVVWYLWAAEQALEGHDLASVRARAERGVACGAKGSLLGELQLLRAEAAGWTAEAGHRELAEEALGLLAVGSAPWARAATELAVACRAAGDHARLVGTAATLATCPASAMSMGHVWALARTTLEALAAGEREVVARLVRHVREAAKAADALDAPLLRELVSWLAAAEELFAGNPHPLLAASESMTKMVEATGQERYAALVSLHAAIASAAASEHTVGLAWAERAFESARRFGLRAQELRARAWIAFFLCQGTFDDVALATAREVVRDAERDHVVAGEARVHVAIALAARGDLASAREEALVSWNEPRVSLDTRGRVGQLLAALGPVDETLARATAEALGRVRVFPAVVIPHRAVAADG